MPEPTEQQWVEIQEQLAGGKMIQAIKLYREHTGVGLKEAKEAMEAYADKLRAEAPDRFPVAKSGCAGIIVLTATGLAAALAAAWALVKPLS